MRPARRGRRERRTIRGAKTGESRRIRTRSEAAEEVGGTSLAFFEPGNASTQGCASCFLHKTVVQLAAEREDGGSGLGVRDVASGATVRQGELAFNATTVGLATTGRNEGEILGVRVKDNFGSVPEGR